MRKFLPLLCCILLLSSRGNAAERRDIALTFDLRDDITNTHTLLEILQEQEISATFFLCGEDLHRCPELAGEILAQGHEIGIIGFHDRSMAPLSRRAIAKEFSDTRALLPKDCRVRFLRPPEMVISDGVRQVAEVTGLSIIHWRLSGENSLPETIRDGDILLLPSSPEQALPLIRGLQNSGFRFLTLSELARYQEVRPRPGKQYDHFSSP